MKLRRKKFRGSAYVLVLAISMLVTVIGVAALTAVRVQIRSAADTTDTDEARIYAQSGLELAKAWINNDSSWRTNRSSGSTATASFGAGSFRLASSIPSTTISQIGRSIRCELPRLDTRGAPRQQLQVTLVPAPTGFTCLNAGVFSAGAMSITGSTLASSGIVATNGNVTVSSGAAIDCNVEAAGSVSGSGYLGSKTAGVTARTVPDSTVFDYYKKIGTAIAYSSLVGPGDFHDLLLSPANNPYGSTDPNGIYVIDCGGNTIHIHMCRVVGTLVILNCKSDSKIDGQVNFAPAVSNLPTLMIQGAVAINFDNNTLKESAGKNFNPPGTPYNGATNSTTTDTYPSIISGLTYISGNVAINSTSTFGGPLIVGGTLGSAQAVTGKYDATYLTNPPPGFFSNPPMKVSASSWAQTVN